MDQISGWTRLPYYGPGRGVEQGTTSSAERDPAGRWTIRASGRDDVIRVQESQVFGRRVLDVSVNQDFYRIPLAGWNAATSVGIYAGAGNDAVLVDPNVTFPLFIAGEEGNDFLKGGSGPNALVGGPGNDTLIGGPSDDLLLGGSGFNTIQGNGGRDMYSLGDLYHRLHRGDGHRPFPQDPSPRLYDRPPMASPEPVTAQPTPPPVPVVVAPPPPPPQIIQTPRPRPPAPPPPPKPRTPPRPPLSSLMAAVDTYNEKGFKSGRDMTKNLLTSVYESPDKFHQTLASISGAKEKDDAVASFARALLDAGPAGGRLLRSIPPSDLKTMAQYLSVGNSWSANKKGIMLLLSKMTGVTGPGTMGLENDPSANEFLRRYQGVL